MLSMKKIFLFLLSSCIFFTNCNNSPKEEKKETGNSKSEVDSLYDEVITGHDEAMGKYGKLKSAETQIQRILDSINKLPAKTKVALSPLKSKMDSALANLRNSKDQMDKWMDEINLDSALNNTGQRVKYLLQEKIKVSDIRSKIISSIQKADSLIHSRF
jgi:DNA repair ATPase RecN